MKMSIAIMVAILLFMPIVSGTNTITDVRWNANLKVIEILFDKFPDEWGSWTMYVDGKDLPMEGGSGNAVVRPNAAIGKATGLFVGTDPWLHSLEGVDFPCCGTIQFSIPDQGLTNRFDYDLTKTGCKTTSPKTECATGTLGIKLVGITVPPENPTPTPDSGIKLEDNVDLPGMNLGRGYILTSADPRICANDCAKNPDCKAFTYVKPGFREPNSPPECYLKKCVPDPVLQKYCISGIKPGATESPCVDYSKIPGLVLHLWHNVNQPDPKLAPTNLDLIFFHGGDLGASGGDVGAEVAVSLVAAAGLPIIWGSGEGKGYNWWMIKDNPSADPADPAVWNKQLPPGLVLGLFHSPNLDQWKKDITVFGESAVFSLISKNQGREYHGLIKYFEADTGGGGGMGQLHIDGFYWFETNNSNFQNWDYAEKNLPKGTILGLKHSEGQRNKKVTWRGQTYDPVQVFRTHSAAPPTFVARHGGDLGAKEGQGFYWFEKTTGPDFFQPSG